MNYKNPWADRHVRIERQYFAESEREMGPSLMEARDAEERGSIVCGNCGGAAWFKPTVGAYKCVECGKLRVGLFRNPTTGEERGGLSGEQWDSGEWTEHVERWI